MIIYRPNRGGLTESVSEAREFDSIEAMKGHIVEHWASKFDGRKPFDIDDIVLGEESVDDPRTGWNDTRHVCVKRFGNEDYVAKYGSAQCIGQCATDYDKQE